jgi:TrmH family RNA methyltransferase
VVAVSGERSGPPVPGVVKRVTSLANPIVKDIRGLALGKNRKASGQFVVEGLKLVADGVEAGWQLATLVYSDAAADQPLLARLAARCRAGGGTVISVNHAVLAKISRRENPQTVLGVFPQRLAKAAALRPEADDLWVALEQVRDPGNFGTIVRTADAVGAAGVILIGDTVDPFSLEAVRATMGSLFHVTIAKLSAAEFETFARAFPGAVIGTHLTARDDYRKVPYPRPTLIVMGAEQAGLSPPIAATCQRLVRIPMAGRADSLNLAVATGIILYEARRDTLASDG